MQWQRYRPVIIDRCTGIIHFVQIKAGLVFSSELLSLSLILLFVPDILLSVACKLFTELSKHYLLGLWSLPIERRPERIVSMVLQ